MSSLKDKKKRVERNSDKRKTAMYRTIDLSRQDHELNSSSSSIQNSDRHDSKASDKELRVSELEISPNLVSFVTERIDNLASFRETEEDTNEIHSNKQINDSRLETVETFEYAPINTEPNFIDDANALEFEQLKETDFEKEDNFKVNQNLQDNSENILIDIKSIQNENKEMTKEKEIHIIKNDEDDLKIKEVSIESSSNKKLNDFYHEESQNVVNNNTIQDISEVTPEKNNGKKIANKNDNEENINPYESFELKF